MAKESFDQGPVMPLTPHLQDAGLDGEATRVAKVAFAIARIALRTPHPNDPITDAMAKRTVELVKAGERNPDLLSEKLLAEMSQWRP
jgi:hypothetical protein